MILWALLDLHDDLALFFTVVPLTIIALLPMLVFHEVSHGWIAHWMGDDTAKSMGRLSFNPISHLDKTGTILLLLVGFGWAKPVPINPYRLGMEPRKGMAIVGAAGPLSNFFMAAVFSLALRAGFADLPDQLVGLSFSHLFGLWVLYVVQINLILGTLNLLPVPPLDGFRVAVGVLPREYAMSLAKLEQHAMPILMMLFFFLMFTGFLGTIVESLTNSFLGQNVY